jgi:amino acid transporter
MSTEERAPQAELGLLDATMIGMGAMIGAGIFVLTGLAAEIAGPAAILVFALNGVVTAFTGLSYAELASAIPKSGGGYAFVREVFDDLVSFVMGWMLWAAYMIAGGLYALGFAPNFLELVHVYAPGLVPDPAELSGGDPAIIALALVAVLGLVVLNAVSTAASGSVETIFTAVKVLILVVFVAFGFASAGGAGEASFDLQQFQPFFVDGAGPLSILPAMALTFIAFEGYDLITTVTEEVENPRENIPKAIFVSLIATVIVYLSVVSVAVGTIGATGEGSLAAAGERGIAEAATQFMPTGIPLIRNGGALVVFGAVFSTLTALNAVVIASSRVAFSMGREGQLLPRFGQLHHRFGTPLVAVVASAALMIGTLPLPTSLVGNLSSLFFLLSFVVVNGAVIKLRRARPDMRRPYEMPFYPLPAVLGIVFNLVLTLVFVVFNPLVLGIGAVAVLVGVVVYYLLEWYGPATEPGVAGPEPTAPAGETTGKTETDTQVSPEDE